MRTTENLSRGASTVAQQFNQVGFEMTQELSSKHLDTFELETIQMGTVPDEQHMSYFKRISY